MPGNVYTRLDSSKQEIRLVRLFPPQRHSAIKCELFIVSLHHRPSYEALSYAWGHSRHDYSIQLNDCAVSVTDNLYRALCQLRPFAVTRLLWIDQLCINRSDDDEHAQQVQLMGTIYSASYRTLLWLGDEACVDPLDVPSDQIQVPKTRPCTWTWIKEGTAANASAGCYRPLIKAEFDAHGESEYKDDYIYLTFCLVSELASSKRFKDIPYISSEEGSGREVLRALWFLMHRPWWGRVWTVQECILAPNSVILYGPVMAPFEMFLLAASSYNSQAISSESELPQRLPRANATILRHFSQTLTDIDAYRQRQLSGQKIDLVSALRSFRIREATDDRDKIYGLLGLDIDWHGQEPLYPSYQLSTPQVYQNATFKLIQSTQSLKVLLNNFDKYGDSRKTVNLESKPEPLALPPSASPELQALLQQIDSWKVELQNEPFFVDAERSNLQLPSWVPDWSSSTNFEVLSRYNQAELYSAARATTTAAALCNGLNLALQGMEVDIVRWSSQIMAHTGGEDRSSLFKDWRDFAEDATAYNSASVGTTNALSTIPGLSPLEDTFWRTLCGDTVISPNPNSPISTFHRATIQNYQDFLFWCRAHEPGLLPNSTIPSEDTGPLLQDTVPTQKSLDSIRNAMEPAIRTATTMRRLFITRKGRLGLGPPQTVGGEKIFVLYGGKAPFVLRAKTEKTINDGPVPCYELVGDCYVHGIMDGEAMDLKLPESEVLLV
ncbi:hypothetical protein MMC24_007316 [Lignoscripta atroalba]|nr:hypothetical protein [Lignoscripta atroalba]